VELRRYLWGKFMMVLLPMLFLAEVLIIGTNHMLEVTDFMMILSSSTMFFMVFGIVAMGIGFGAVHCNFKYQNIAQVSTGFGGVLFMITSSLFIAIITVLEAGPVYILFMSNLSGKAITALQWIFIITSFAAVFGVSLVAIFKPMKMGLKALEEYE
jgi:ABC-2 type transport system permease protein